jgi:cold shock CspA family protein
MVAKKLIGKIVEWDTERGFGFLQSGSARVFLHHREFSERRKNIGLGDRISFLMGSDAQDRPCAMWADHVGHGGTLSIFHLLLLGDSSSFPESPFRCYPLNGFMQGHTSR